MTQKSRLRRVLLPLALLVTALAAMAPAAQAWNLTEHSVTWSTASGQLSPMFGYGTNITGNMALNAGSGSVKVCQVTYDYSANGAVHEGCGTNGVGNALNLTPYYGHLLATYVMHYAGSQHLVRQVMYTGTP